MRSNLLAMNVSVVIRRGDQFLLIKRADDEEFFPGYWGIPGGSVEADDSSLEEALARECMEEVDVSIKNIQLISNNIVKRGDNAVVFLTYTAEILKGKPEPKDGTVKVEWKTIKEARKLRLTPKTLDLLESTRKELNK